MKGSERQSEVTIQYLSSGKLTVVLLSLYNSSKISIYTVDSTELFRSEWIFIVGYLRDGPSASIISGEND